LHLDATLTNVGSMKARFLFVCLLAAALHAGLAEIVIGPDSSLSDRRLAAAFENRISGFRVRLRGEVVEIFRHYVHSREKQEFVVRLDSGQTVLIIHNKTFARPVPRLRLGNRVSVMGRYRWNNEGGYVDQTNTLSCGCKFGWIRRNGKKYD
jgi:hypothetical protein